MGQDYDPLPTSNTNLVNETPKVKQNKSRKRGGGFTEEQEQEVPYITENYVYENGNVWESTLPPINTPNSSNGILKKENNESRSIQV